MCDMAAARASRYPRPARAIEHPYTRPTRLIPSTRSNPWSNVASQVTSRFSITAAWTASRADSPGVDSRIRFARSVSASVTLKTVGTSPKNRSYTRSARSAVPSSVYR